MDLLKDQLETVLTMAGSSVTNRMHNGINILEMRDPDTRDIFYCAFVDNHFVGSYTSKLVESAINSRNKPKIGLDHSFIEAEKLVSGKGLVRVFINYARLPQFLNIYLGKPGTSTSICSAIPWILPDSISIPTTNGWR